MTRANTIAISPEPYLYWELSCRVGYRGRIIDPRVLGSLLFAVALTSPELPVMRCHCQERCCLLSEDVDKAYRGLQRVKRLNSITTNEGVPEC